jgi:hypothetical protein
MKIAVDGRGAGGAVIRPVELQAVHGKTLVARGSCMRMSRADVGLLKAVVGVCICSSVNSTFAEPRISEKAVIG